MRRCVLLPRTYSGYAVSALSRCSPPRAYRIPVPLHCAHILLRTALTPSCGSFYLVRNAAGCPAPRQRDSQSLLGTVWRQHVACRCDARRQAKTSSFDGTWRQRWPSRSGCLKLAIPSLDSGSKIGHGGAISTGGTHSTELLHIMDQAARWLVLPGSHGPLGRWSWVFPKRCY